MKRVQPVIQFVVSLLLACAVWAWLRVLGAFWVNDGLYLVETTFSTLFIARLWLTSFLVIFVPAALVYWYSKNKSVLDQFIIYLSTGSVLTVIYLINVAEFDVVNILHFISLVPVVFAAGVWASLVFCGIDWLPIWDRGALLEENMREENKFSRVRRNILSGMALTAGGAGLVSGLVGPYRILAKTGDYIEVNLEELKAGEYIMVELSGKPVWILKRTPDIIDNLSRMNNALLDPDSRYSRQPESMQNTFRSAKPEYFITYAICTHLGCSVSFNPDGAPDQFPYKYQNIPVLSCPCHNGVFDMAGKVYKGTPPKENLRIPDYEFISEHVVRIYYPSIIDRWNDVYSD